MFDSHCHLQNLKFGGEIGGVIERARKQGVAQMLCCGTRPSDWGAVEAFAAEFSEVIPAYGVHPWYVDEAVDGDWRGELCKYLLNNPKAAIGEIGLDFAVRPRRDDLQMELFVEQLRLAEMFERAVSVHCVRAWGRLIEALKVVGEMRHGVVIHSFMGSPEVVQQLLPYGVYFSFSASIATFDYERAATIVAAVPQERLLIETDAPNALSPGLQDKEFENEPVFLPVVADILAEASKGYVSEIVEITTENARRVFG